jgi:hypothetical protein
VRNSGSRPDNARLNNDGGIRPWSFCLSVNGNKQSPDICETHSSETAAQYLLGLGSHRIVKPFDVAEKLYRYEAEASGSVAKSGQTTKHSAEEIRTDARRSSLLGFVVLASPILQLMMQQRLRS